MAMYYWKGMERKEIDRIDEGGVDRREKGGRSGWKGKGR